MRSPLCSAHAVPPLNTLVPQQPIILDMPPIDRSEIRPGIVVHLDTEVLRREGGSESNAEVTADGDRAVRGPHYFLVVEVDMARQCALARLPPAWWTLR